MTTQASRDPEVTDLDADPEVTDLDAFPRSLGYRVGLLYRGHQMINSR